MKLLPLRLDPGVDLREALQGVLPDNGSSAGFVICGIGSLAGANLRPAGAEQGLVLPGDLEILTLSGSLSRDGVHLHMSLADAGGRVWGGHVQRGCIVRTTAEILVALLPDWHFDRAPDAATGYLELLIRRK